MIRHADATRPPFDETLLSLVLPVYNEEEVLAELLDSLIEAVGPCRMRYEIVFVDDGSRDRSSMILDCLAAENPHVRVVHLSRNFGHQAAVQAGLAHARGDAVILMDADLQDTPEAIPNLVDAWQAGYDVVYAIRTDRKESRLKRTMFATFYRLLAAISTTPLPLDAGNFGLIDRRVAREIVGLAERDRYYAGLRAWVGFRQKGIEVARAARYDQTPRVSFWGLVRLAKTAVFSFSTAPLAVFQGIGIAALALFVIAGAGAASSVAAAEALPAWIGWTLAGSFFAALNALGIAALGAYISRIYDQVRGRPIYVVDHTVNFELHAERMAGETAFYEAATTIAAAERDALAWSRRLAAEAEADDEDAQHVELLAQAASLLAALNAGERGSTSATLGADTAGAGSESGTTAGRIDAARSDGKGRPAAPLVDISLPSPGAVGDFEQNA